MRLFFSFIFFFFSSFQSQAQVLIEYEIAQDMDQFDWSAFSDKETIQKYIDFSNQRLRLFGAGINTITGLNIGKIHLVQIEQELDLYRRGIKIGLSVEKIQLAEEAIALHWENVNSIENQIQAYGLGDSAGVRPKTPLLGDPLDYRNGVWELHKGDHEVLFNMVEKKDETLYKALGGDDEAYAGFITPYMERYMKKTGETAGAYWSSLQSAYSEESFINTDDVASLIEMYSHSLEIYECFNKNFNAFAGENQQELMRAVQNWHTRQALVGADSLIKTYNVYGEVSNPSAVVAELLGFYKAPESVKEKIGSFLRKDIFNHEDYINTDDRIRLGARVRALIGLNSFGIATLEEQELFHKAIEQGVIRYRNPHNFSGRAVPLPE